MQAHAFATLLLTVLALGASAAPATVPPGATGARASVLYAAPNGHGGTCSRSAPCDLAGAKARVECLVRDMHADIDIELAGGTYRLAEGMTLGPADSGRNGHRVVWRARPGQVPVFNGAVRVSAFTEYDARLDIWRARVPRAALERAGEQLFVDGQRAQLARSTAPLPGVKVTAQGFSTTDPAYASFRGQRRIQVVEQSDWKHVECPVASITRAPDGGSDINVLPSCWKANHVDVPNLGFPFNGSGLPKMSRISYIEDAYGLLQHPGQFYLDKAAGYLYYIPRRGQDLARADVELPVAQSLLTLQGTPGHLAPVNQNVAGAKYSGAGWKRLADRNMGDLGNDVEATPHDGDAMTYAFVGTGVEVLGATSPDGATFTASLDGKPDKWQRFGERRGAARLAQQVVYATHSLAPGRHVIKLTKTGGGSLTIDGFQVIPAALDPVRDMTFRGIHFAYTTWNAPATVGYIDNQAGVLWDTAGTVPRPAMVPAAVTVSRGRDITFTHDVFEHLGANAIHLADGTQHSTVARSTVTDTAGGGIYVGDVDDYFQNDPALMTLGDKITDDRITHVGQDYSDTVGVWAGYTRGLVIAHNDVGHTPYSGMSIGWGWGYQSACALQAHEGLKTCEHGTSYAGGNAVIDNHVHDVMRVLHDGGPIYTNGGQGEDGAGVYSTLAGNYVEGAHHSNNMLYQDEGSSYWHTYDNVVNDAGHATWIGMWTPTINHITIGPRNYASTAKVRNHGTAIAYTAPIVVTDGAWPAAAKAIMQAAGPRGHSTAHE
ncbi:MAG TPA: hypothetical protein VF292_13975 [Rhodanobacteraceae bacterium]